MAKTKTVSKADLVDTVANATSMKKKDVKEVMDSMLDKISANLDLGNKVQLTGFCTFEVPRRKALFFNDTATTEKIKIPASKYPAFKPGKSLKEQVKK